MASLVRPTKTYYALDGKRVPKGTPAAERVRERSSKWYGQGVPGMGKRRGPLAADKEAARRILAQLVRDAEQGAAGMPSRAAGRMPLADHLTAFEQAVRLGLASRSKKKRRPSDEVVALAVARVREVLDGCGFRQVADLNASASGKLAGWLQSRAGVPRRDGGMSRQTAAFYLTNFRRFTWWLSARQNAPVRADLFDDIPGFDPSAARVHARREIPPADLERILTAARDSKQRHRGLSGTDRFFLYMTAFGSGYRAGELSVLTPAHFDMDADPPLAVLPGEFTKNGRPARQPLPPGGRLGTPAVLRRPPGRSPGLARLVGREARTHAPQGSEGGRRPQRDRHPRG